MVFDTIGSQTQHDSFGMMAPDALLMSIDSDPSTDQARGARQRASFLMIQPNAAALEQMATGVDAGQAPADHRCRVRLARHPVPRR